MKPCVILAAVGGLLLGVQLAKAQTSHEGDLDQLLDAIALVESRSNPKAVGDSGRALGLYQIHRRYWIDGTRILGVGWSYDEAGDPAKAREVVRAYLMHYGQGRSLLEKARIHNGGPRGYRKKATLAYARKIARVLQEELGES
jgi:soluble lytic murein transglycosylase-like protein